MKSNNKYFGFGIIFLLLILILFIYYNNIIILLYPENNGIITERQPTFKWVGKANKLVIDDSDEFVSPIIENVKSSPYQLKNKLNFTTYYWKLVGKRESSVSQFSVQSLVALRLQNQSDLYNVSNIGNTNLDVEIQEKKGSFWKVTGSVVLEQNKTKQFEIKNSTVFVAKQR